MADDTLKKQVDEQFEKLIRMVPLAAKAPVTPAERKALEALRDQLIDPIARLSDADSEVRGTALREIESIKDKALRIVKVKIHGEASVAEQEKQDTLARAAGKPVSKDSLTVTVDLMMSTMFNENTPKYTQAPKADPASPLSPLVALIAANNSQLPMGDHDQLRARLGEKLSAQNGDYAAHLSALAGDLKTLATSVHETTRHNIATVIDVATPALPALDFAFGMIFEML